jgi:hypothetical protein
MKSLTAALRMDMLHRTFIREKIIVVGNWGGRARMEEFLY